MTDPTHTGCTGGWSRSSGFDETHENDQTSVGHCVKARNACWALGCCCVMMMVIVFTFDLPCDIKMFVWSLQLQVHMPARGAADGGTLLVSKLQYCTG